MGEKGGEHQLRAGQDFGTPFFYDYHDIAADDELYHALASDKRLGHNVQRLMGRDVAVKRFADMLAVKLPQGARGGRGDGDTVYHQDGPRLPYDRVGT